MSGALPPLARVAVLGNGCTYVVSGAAKGVRTPAYPEVVERLLDVEVVPAGRGHELASAGRRRFEQEVRPRHPAVLVVHYGILEVQPAVIPWGLARALTSADLAAASRVGALRRAAARRCWPALRSWQRWASARAGTRTWRLRPSLFAAEVTRLARFARHDGALVLIHDITPPGPGLAHWLPGMGERVAIGNAALAEAVARRADPDVRLLRSSSILEQLDPAVAIPDGWHWGPQAHLRAGQMVAAEIGPWLGANGLFGADRPGGGPRTAAATRKPGDAGSPT